METTTTGFAFTSNITSYLPSIGQTTKWLLVLVLLMNIRAFPLVWHVRVFRPLIYIWVKQLFLSLRTLPYSKSTKARSQDEFFEALTPIGVNPFEHSTVWRSWASWDECDYNLHLSNSSYAKALDGARFKLAFELFPQFFRAGGIMPLAATHFHFIREIPMLSKYEVRISLASWDEKWIHIICRFVSKSKPKHHKKPIQSSPSTPSTIFHPPTDTGYSSSVSVSGTSTPSFSSKATASTSIPSLSEKLLSLSSEEQKDGYTLHTVTLSQMCFKIGRITVPPAVVMALNGLSASSSYSRANPPVYWDTMVKSLGSSSKTGVRGGDKRSGYPVKAAREFMKGGWRDVPKDERWWEGNDVLGAEVEVMRSERLRVVDAIRTGMDGVREM